MLLYEDYVWVSLGNAMEGKQSKGMASQHVRLSAVSAHPMGFGPLHGEQGQDAKGRTNGPARTLRPLRDPDGGEP
jgi:hypothetical protein